MSEHEAMARALNEKDESAALELLAGHPGLKDRRFLNYERQRGHSAPLLLHAAELGMTALARELLRGGVDADVYGGNGATALHFAASGGHAETVKVLLDGGATVDAKCSMWGNTPLGWLGGGESEGIVECTRMLLAAGADAGVRSSRGYTPHDRARLYGPEELTAFFAEIGAPCELPPDETTALGGDGSTSPEGLVLHVVMREGGPQDLCGHDLEVDGTIAPEVGRAGGTALGFSGGCVRVAHEDGFNAAGGISVATWLRLGSDARDENTIISKGRWERRACPWELGIFPDWDLTFHCYGERAHERCTFQSPPRREWHHIAAVWDGKRQHLYIDGIAVASAWAGEQPRDNRVPVTLGQRADDPDCYRNPLHGALEDVVIFDRALPAEKIAVVMALTDRSK